jgi:hypothetical protein
VVLETSKAVKAPELTAASETRTFSHRCRNDRRDGKEKKSNCFETRPQKVPSDNYLEQAASPSALEKHAIHLLLLYHLFEAVMCTPCGTSSGESLWLLSRFA